MIESGIMALPAAHIDAPEVVRVLAVEIGYLHDHVVLLALALEAGHLAAAEQGLERAAKRINLDANGSCLVAVHSHVELWGV
jgi:hypothetical protein